MARVLLRELVDVDDLDLRVRAFDEGLDRRIRWVHTTELIDPSIYLQGAELMLTTGVWRQRRGDSGRFTSALAKVGVAGLVYGLPEPDGKTPRDLVLACERHEIPLLEASHELPFMAISEAVFGSFGREHDKVFRGAIQRNQQLVDVIARGAGIQGILRVLTRGRALQASLVGPGGYVLGDSSASAPAELPAVWRAIAGASAFPAEIPLPGERLGTAFPVTTTGAADGYLVVDRAIDALTPEELTTVDQAVAFLALELSRTHTIRAVNQRFTVELLDLIAAGDARSADLASRLRVFGVDPEQSLVTAVVLLDETAARQESRCAELMERFFAVRQIPAVVPAVDKEAVALFSVPADGFDPARLGHELSEAVQAGVPSAVVALGVGGVANGAAGLRRSLVEARHAAQLGSRRDGGSNVATYEQIGLVGSHSLLLALQEEELRVTFCSALLGPVLAYDARRGTDLVHTLDVFLERNGHWQAAASELHVHVNTLRYRLARVEQLTGRDLNAMANRVDFYLALRASDGGTRLPEAAALHELEA